MKRSGVADLPLHGGRVPEWLAQRMTKLGAAITEVIIRDYGPSAILSRLSDPFWFQALGAVMGMDWHSSGITTSVMGALKRGLRREPMNWAFTSAAAAAGFHETRHRNCVRSPSVAGSMAKPWSATAG